MKRLILLLPLLALVGCVTAHVECPTDGSTTTVAVGGSTVGQQLLTAGLMAAKTAGFLAAKRPEAAPAPTATGSYVDYKFLAIWGPDYASCAGNIQPAAASTPTVIVVPAPPAQPSILTSPQN